MINLHELAHIVGVEIKHAISPLKEKIKSLEDENQALRKALADIPRYDDSEIKQGLADVQKKLDNPVDMEQLVKLVVKEMPEPEIAQYKGVFAEGVQYIKNDSVTRNGSLWIAKQDAPEGVPSSGESDWQLAVKRGARGKSFIESARENGFKGTEQDLIRLIMKGDKPDPAVKL